MSNLKFDDDVNDDELLAACDDEDITLKEPDPVVPTGSNSIEEFHFTHLFFV